jgi:hypothetical protein
LAASSSRASLSVFFPPRVTIAACLAPLSHQRMHRWLLH